MDWEASLSARTEAGAIGKGAYYLYFDIIPRNDKEFRQIAADVKEILGSLISHLGPVDGYKDGEWFRIEGSFEELYAVRRDVRRLSRGKRKFNFAYHTINECSVTMWGPTDRRYEGWIETMAAGETE